MQRFRFFARDIVEYMHRNQFHVFTARVNDDESITYAWNAYTLMMNNHSGKVFTVQTLKGGFHITPNKVTIWKGLKLDQVHSDAMIAIVKHIGCDWLLSHREERGQYPLLALLTPTSLTRVVKGKITNPKGLMHHYLTYSGRYRHLKLAKYTNMLLDIFSNTRQGYLFHELLDACATDVNPEALIQYAHNNEGKLPQAWRTFIHQHDMTHECHQLGVKMNHMWSDKRLHEEHTKLSRQVREVTVLNMELDTYEYNEPCPMLPGMELISNNKRLWEEGSMMNHCIYSYLNGAKERDVFHFHVTIGDKPFSLAVQQKYDGSKYVVQQMFLAHNARCAPAQHEIVDYWLQEEAVQAWFKNEANSKRSSRDYGLAGNLPF